MGDIVQKKRRCLPELDRHNQHIALDGTTSCAFKSSQIKSISQHRFEDHSQQLRDGSYPLHMAIASGATIQVLEMLVKAAPEVASKADKFGRTCLHLAVKNGGVTQHFDGGEDLASTLEAVKLVHSLDSNLIRAKDKRGQLPLHVACEAGCSIEVINFLLLEYPDGANAKNIDGARPADLALTKEMRSSFESGSIGTVEISQ